MNPHMSSACHTEMIPTEEKQIVPKRHKGGCTEEKDIPEDTEEHLMAQKSSKHKMNANESLKKLSKCLLKGVLAIS